LRPAQVNSLRGPISKILNPKKGWRSGSSGSACLASARPSVQIPEPQKKRKGKRNLKSKMKKFS
jgi:hypothetical protein